MSRYRKFTTICCAAVFALGLAACGGGDDGLNTSQEQELQEQKNAADEMVAELQKQLAALQERLGIEGDEDPGHDVANLRAEIERLEGEIEEAEKEKMAADMKAMVATAAKLYAGISAPTDETDAVTRRHATYVSSDIRVTIGSGTDDLHTLKEDKTAMVDDNHGWQGKRYADAAGGPMVEAMVYSNVADPTPGKMFGDAEPGEKYMYTLANGVLTAANADGDANEDMFIPARVAFTDVTRTAGTETFEKGSNDVAVMIPGSYHGVSGTYSCTPAGNSCTAMKAEKGFTLGADGTWTFKPDNASARVMDTADTSYASYGWWIRKDANDKEYIASAFTALKGTEFTSIVQTTFDALQGTAMYMGGAAGKYALTSSTGGTNDAGHFTARAMLEADFDDGTERGSITGTIDMFMGADGMPRDWKVALKRANFNDVDPGDGTAFVEAMGDTTWTIDGSAAEAAGNWTGHLLDQGKDDVPQVATGMFYTEYGTAGKMVGAFGANVQ